MAQRRVARVPACIELALLGAMLLAARTPGDSASETARPRDGGIAGGLTGIIVLGGDLGPFLQDPALPAGQRAVPNRVSDAVRLARRHPGAMVLYAGRERAPGPLPTLIRDGLAGSRIVWEDRSQTTAENATFAADLVHPRPGERWILVTNDWHMDRAESCFRRAGFAVAPHPVHGTRPDVTGVLGRYREFAARLAYAALGLCDR